jgi:hypothetical protein
MIYTGETPNARYGRIVLGIYAAVNGLLLIAVCASTWFFTARANSHGIAPNTTLGFRSQHTLASLHGWYVAQRVGFHFAAVANTVIAAAVFTVVAVAFIRRWNAAWILVAPIFGGIAVGVCFMIAGQRADQAAISVETSAAPTAELMMPAAVGASAATEAGLAAEKAAVLATGGAQSTTPYGRTPSPADFLRFAPVGP